MTVEQLKDTLEKSIAAKKLLLQYDHPNQKRQLEEDVRQTQLDLTILVDFTIPQTMRLRDAAVVQAKLMLEKQLIDQEATLKWGEIEIKGKEKVLRKKKEKLAELLEQKEKLTVTAERDGLILYRLTWGEHGVALQIKAGAKVNPRQRLLEIPDMTTLEVETIVFESKNRHVRIGYEDMRGSPAIVTLDALPNREFQGHVTRRSTLPKINGQKWMETGARVYELFIEVDWEAAGLSVGKQLKPGMKCNVEVVLEEVPEALQVPISAVTVREGRFVCKKVAGSMITEQEISLGRMNDRFVEVRSGLEEGDVVLTDIVDLPADERSEDER